MRARLVLIALAVLPGCAAVPPDACGPLALFEAYGSADVEADPADIGREIRDAGEGGTALRSALGVCRAAGSITWPWEIGRNARRHGLSVCEVGGGDAALWRWASSGDVGVLLLRRRGALFPCHYVSVPVG